MPNVKVVTMTKPAWYEIKNATADVAEVYIYDQIGEDWWTGAGVTAKGFVDELSKVTAPQIHLRINSPGGSVFDAQAIYTALNRHPATVTTFIDGLAASAASYIALAGDRVVMAANALLMIHNPMGGVTGDATDMRKMADVLDKIRDTIVGIYADKTKKRYEDLVDAMDAETWYTAREALEAGFVDEVGVALDVAAHMDLSTLKNMGYKHVPAIVTVPEVANATEPEVTPTVPESDGASESAASDGASEATHNEAYVPGVGFANF